MTCGVHNREMIHEEFERVWVQLCLDQLLIPNQITVLI